MCIRDRPEPPANHPEYAFRFIDLFAGIGGIRKGFEAIGGQCVFTSEWNKDAVRTYKANWFNDEQVHKFNLDIREVTLSDKTDVLETDAYAYIDEHVPDHDVLLAGFPCQPFSLAGVSKKNSLGRAHGFECEAQGTLFFDVARIIPVSYTHLDATSAGGVLRVPITCSTTGAVGNADDGTALILVTPVNGLPSSGVADTLTGGFDTEDLETWRARVIERYYWTPQGGADGDYVVWAKEVPGITRAWTYRCLLYTSLLFIYVDTS